METKMKPLAQEAVATETETAQTGMRREDHAHQMWLPKQTVSKETPKA
jgi:hypothetical protein